MIIAGIDTAIRTTGYGVVEMRSPTEMRVLDCGVIKNKAGLPHSECLRRIAGGIRTIIAEFRPDAASIEDAFVRENIKTAMILSLARGAVITMFAEASVPVYAYSPTTAKKAVTGTGKAEKEQVAAMMAAMLSINIADIPDDSTDALALAVCHGQMALRENLAFLMPKPL